MGVLRLLKSIALQRLLATVMKMKNITSQEGEGLFGLGFFSHTPKIFHLSCKGSSLISAPWEENWAEKGVCFAFPHYHFQGFQRRQGFHQEILQGFELCADAWETNHLLCGKRITDKQSLRSKLPAVYNRNNAWVPFIMFYYSLCLMKTLRKFSWTAFVIYYLTSLQVEVTEKGSGF